MTTHTPKEASSPNGPTLLGTGTGSDGHTTANKTSASQTQTMPPPYANGVAYFRPGHGWGFRWLNVWCDLTFWPAPDPATCRSSNAWSAPPEALMNRSTEIEELADALLSLPDAIWQTARNVSHRPAHVDNVNRLWLDANARHVIAAALWRQGVRRNRDLAS